MGPDGAFDPNAPEPALARDTIRDLGLGLVVLAMAREDPLLARAARSALAAPLIDGRAIRYRQAVLTDCLAHRGVVREMYARAGEAIDGIRAAVGGLRVGPESVLSGAIEALAISLPVLRWLRDVAARSRDRFSSEGFGSFFDDIEESLDDAFFRAAEGHVRELRHRRVASLTARVGPEARGTDYVPLAKGAREDPGPRGAFGGRRRAQTYRIPETDEQSRRALAELRVHGLTPIVEAATSASNQVARYLDALARELAFYVASINLAEDLEAGGHPFCVPDVPARPRRGVGGPAFVDLRDVALALASGGDVAGHDVDGSSASLVAITGANGGGKSTLLRSIGQAQVMMQAGTIVGARSFASRVAPVIATHFPRAEDATLERGRLEDELHRMSARVDALRPGSLLLCNESFSSTNEREGSEIARQIVRALRESGVRVAYVTHLYDLARGWFREEADAAVFLRAERGDDGARPFRFAQGEPLATSYGTDLYQEVFGGDV